MSDLMEVMKACEAECHALSNQLREKRDLAGEAMGKLGNGEPACNIDLKKDIAKKFSEGCAGSKVSDSKWVDDENLLTFLQNGQIIMWNVATREKAYFLYKKTWFMAGAVAPDKRLLAAGGLDNVVTIYPLPDLATNYDGIPDEADMKLKAMSKHTASISAIRFLDQDTVISASGDDSLMVWDISKDMGVQKQPEQTLYGHGLLHEKKTGDVNAVDTKASCNKTFISASSDGLAKLWDLRVDPATNFAVRTFYGGATGGLSAINEVKYMPDGNSFITAQDDGKCNLFDVRMGALLATYQQGETGLISCETSRSGRYIFTGSASGKIKCFSTLNPSAAPELLKQFHGEGNPITSLSVNPSGTALASTQRAASENVGFYA